MAEVLITYGVPSEGFAETLVGHTFHIPPLGKQFSSEELAVLLPKVDAAVACTPFTREMMAQAKRLKLIVCYGAGYDSIDIPAATEHGILVCNIPDTVSEPTAEFAFACLLCLARRLLLLNSVIRTDESASYFAMGKNMGSLLEGATLGIVGMGRIGGRVADFGRAMGMKILYTAQHRKPEREALGDHQASLPEIMAQSDYISIHCPQTPETTGMISAEMLALMKPTAYLINTARGAIIQEEALLYALREHKIAGAAIDVFMGEPHINPAFFHLDNVLLTPHAGSNTSHTRHLMATEASQRILHFWKGEMPKNLLNTLVNKG